MSSTGTITAAQRDESSEGTWSNDYGTFHVWNVVIDAGGEAIETSVNRKLMDGASKDPTGEAVELKNGKWKVVSQQSGGSGGGGNSGGGKYEADKHGLRGKNASSALHAAISLVEATKGEVPISSDAVVALASKFYDFLESKAKVGE